MKEQLISFETAKLAKEKGFNEKSTHFYVVGYNSVKEDKVIRKWGNYEDNTKLLQPVSLGKGQPHLALAPTQSLLAKWLREKHNIIVECYHDYDPKDKGNQYYASWGFIQAKDINGNQNVNGWYDEYNDWKKYEDALEFGLQEALKMIK